MSSPSQLRMERLMIILHSIEKCCKVGLTANLHKLVTCCMQDWGVTRELAVEYIETIVGWGKIKVDKNGEIDIVESDGEIIEWLKSQGEVQETLKVKVEKCN